MKKFLLLLIIVPFFILPGAVSSQGKDYTLLEPSVYNDTYKTTGSKTFSDYLNLVFKIGIGVAAGLAVIQIVIGGIQYMASESPFKIGDAKSKIEGAILGLVLALGIYIFLYTINPDLVSLKLNITSPPPATPSTIPTITSPVSTDSAKTQTNCPNCVFIPSDLEVKTGACTSLGLPTKTCRANQGIINALLLLKKEPSVSNVNWQITEAWPPTYPHKSSCHNNGGCVDLNFTAGWFSGVNKSPENINKFCVASRNVGLKPFYEVKTASERDSLAASGVTCVRAVSAISASHFHMEY